jgi:enamine deaminase RidA (YjgF/YER057c/UK114 family)
MCVMTIRDDLLKECAKAINFSVDAPVAIGGKYVPAVEDQGILSISGQVARVGDAIAVQGKVGQDVSPEQAKLAAQICLVRCLTIAYQRFGSLDAIEKALQMTVHIQSDPHFHDLSEVSDGASELLYDIFGDAGRHARTTVGVASLPKNSTVEIDLSLRVK